MHQQNSVSQCKWIKLNIKLSISQKKRNKLTQDGNLFCTKCVIHSLLKKKFYKNVQFGND